MYRPALPGTIGRLSSFGAPAVAMSLRGCGGAAEQRRFNTGSKLFRDDFNRKSDVLLKKQRIQGFRYKDRAAPMPPHKKYAVDPTAWNRADRAEARTERTSELLVQRVLDRDVTPQPPEEPPSAGDATLFGSDIVAHPPLPDSARLTAQAFFGVAEGVDAWVYVRDTLRELRDPVQAQRRTPKAVQRMAAQLAEAYPALQQALEASLQQRVDVLRSIDSADDLLVVAELANDLRLVLAAAGVPPEQRGGYHTLVDVVVDQAGRLVASAEGGRNIPDDATLLRAVSLVSLSASRGPDAARMVRTILGRSEGTLLSGPALENLAMALTIDGVGEHAVWIVGSVEIAVRRTLAAARSLDKRYDWGNIVPGTTTPVAPAAARFLCGAVKACVSHAPPERVSTERLFRMAATLSQLLEITPNHAMPVPQVVGCAAAVVVRVVAVDDAVDDAECERAVAPWLHTLARVQGRVSTLSASDLMTLVQAALSHPADRAAESNRQCAVDRGAILSSALLQAFAANAALEGSKERFLDVAEPLCLAARVRVRPDVWRCVFRAARACCRAESGAPSGHTEGSADVAAVVAATWLVHARVHERARQGTASDGTELVRWSCEALGVNDLAALVRVLPPVVVGGPLESLREPLADAVFEAICEMERAEEDDGTDTGTAEEDRRHQHQQAWV